MAKILISDDHPFMLMGTKTYIEGLGHHVCEICTNGIAAYNMILHHKPDIALLDMSMPGMNGLEILEKLQSAPVKTHVILLTMHRELSIFRKAKSLNAKGYVLKEFSTDVLDECVEAVLSGRTWFSQELTENLHADNYATDSDVLSKLTFAEKKVLELVGKEHTTREIAALLFIADKTVENHRASIIKNWTCLLRKTPSSNRPCAIWTHIREHCMILPASVYICKAICNKNIPFARPRPSSSPIWSALAYLQHCTFRSIACHRAVR